MTHPAFAFLGSSDDGPGFLGTRYLATGGQLKTLIDAVNVRFEQTNQEFLSAYQHKKITDQFNHRWAGLLSSWRDFYVEVDSNSFVTPVYAATAMDEADDYDTNRINIRNDLKAIAPEDTPGTDTTVTPPPKEKDEPVPWYLNLKTLATIAAVGAVAYVAGPPLVAWATGALATRTAKKVAEQKRAAA